jgi:hypothetical protein
MSYTIYTDPPQSRNEAIIKSTIDGTQYTDPPQSRMEDLLKELKAAIEGGGGGGTTNYNNLENRPQINSHTLEGNMSFADLGIDETPTEDSTNAVASGGVYAGLADKIDKSSSGYQTITGNPLEFDSLSPQMVNMKCDIVASQDLHGYDKPWAGGEGKQLLDFSTYKNISVNIDYSYNDGDVLLTASDDTQAYPNVVFDANVLIGKTFYVSTSFSSSDTELYGHIQCVYELNGENVYVEIGRTPNPLTAYTVPSDATNVVFTLYLRNGDGAPSGAWVKWSKLMVSTEANPTFEPYSNICPISGVDTIDIDVTGGESYTVDLDGTRYGGQLDVTSGLLTLTHGEIVIDEVTQQQWLPSDVYQFEFPTNFEPQNADSEVPTGLICNLTESNSIALVVFNNNYGLACSKTSGVFFINIGISNLTDMNAYLAENPLQVVYELATPQTIQLTPTQVWAVQGGNTITVSVDGVEVEIHSSNYATLKDINDLWDCIKQSPQGISDGVRFGASNLEMIGGTMA